MKPSDRSDGSVSGLVLIPAFNEEASLPSVIGEVQTNLPGFDIIVVNDGSRDRTAAAAAAMGAGIISLPVNAGYGTTVQTGFMYACARGYDTVLLMDADGQHDARDAPALVCALGERKADMVIGSRFAGSAPYKTTFARTVGRRLFSLVTYGITRRRFVDITSGFQALNGRAVAFLSRNYPVDFPDAEVIILMLLNGYRVVEAPANFRQRLNGRSMFSMSRKIYYPFKGLLAIFTVIMRVVLKKEQ